LKREDQRDWTLNRGKTRTSKTGPSVDHTTNSTRGKFVCLLIEFLTHFSALMRIQLTLLTCLAF
jgi:hypothetical protein